MFVKLLDYNNIKKYLFDTYSDLNKLKSNNKVYNFIKTFNLNDIEIIFNDLDLKYFNKDFNKNKSKYIKVFNILYNYDFKKIDMNMILFVSNIKEFDNDKYYDVVLGFDIDYPDMTWALDFISWNEILNYYILEENLKEIDRNRFLYNILWEITFYGFTEEKIKKFTNLLKNE